MVVKNSIEAAAKADHGDLPPLRLEWIEAETLQENPRNWRRHPEKQMAALRDVIGEVGWAGALLFNETTGRLLDGHARKKLGGLVPVLIGAWSEEQERTILATLDPLAAMAEADGPALEALLREVDASSPAVQTLLAELAQEHGLLPSEPSAGLTDPDAIPEPPDEPVTRPGDLWLLGDHRLLCGDSGKSADVDRLLDGATIHLVNTDPVYNVRVEPRSNNAIAAGLSSFAGYSNHERDAGRLPETSQPTPKKKLRAKDRCLKNDFVSPEEYERLLLAWFGNIARVLQPGRAFYIYGGWSNLANFPRALAASELYFSQTLIWVKQHPVLTRKDFLGNHEWMYYGWWMGAAHQFFGPNNVPDVWSIKKVSPQQMIHLTEKPVELAVRAMQYSSKAGENVLDLFGGSGSTLIAAQQTGRKGFLMELDPLYCDVAVRRYEQFTGTKAQRQTAT
jgi:DNA modification methylase